MLLEIDTHKIDLNTVDGRNDLVRTLKDIRVQAFAAECFDEPVWVFLRMWAKDPFGKQLSNIRLDYIHYIDHVITDALKNGLEDSFMEYFNTQLKMTYALDKKDYDHMKSLLQNAYGREVGALEVAKYRKDLKQRIHNAGECSCHC